MAGIWTKTVSSHALNAHNRWLLSLMTCVMANKMRKWESEFHAKLMKWLKSRVSTLSGLIETKVVRPGDTRFRFAELTEKEERLLLLAKHKGFVQTHSDLSQWGTNCDASVVKGGGTIFIQWVRPRNKEFYSIDIDAYLAFKSQHTMKSMTEDDVKLIGTMHVLC